MSSNFFVEIPEKPFVFKLRNITPSKDLSSVVLYREAFTLFEQDVVRSNSHNLQSHRQPMHWDPKHYPDEKSFDYICKVFSEKLPTLDDLRSAVSFTGNEVAIVGGGSCLKGQGHASDIDSTEVVMRLNHPYLSECSDDVGTETTMHLINERRCYELVTGTPKDEFTSVGLFNMFVGTTSETAALLEYARFLDGGGLGTDYFVLKPSFRKSLDVLHDKSNPSLGFLSVGIALRLFEKINLYGFDMGRGSGDHYHGREKLHPAHSPKFEAMSFLDCENNINSFCIYK